MLIDDCLWVFGAASAAAMLSVFAIFIFHRFFFFSTELIVYDLMDVLTRLRSVGFYALCLFVCLASKDKVERHSHKYAKDAQ